MKKTILVLANSFRPGGRCVAGRELTQDVSGNWQLRGWIRPVSASGEGGLNPWHCRVNAIGGIREVAPMDIVEIELIGPAPDEYQCENWTLDITVPMKWIGIAPQSLLNACVEAPPLLLYNQEDMAKVYREMGEVVESNSRSLVLVKVDDVEFTKSVWFDGIRNKARKRAVFTYHNMPYNLPITDPMAEKYFDQAPNGVYRPEKQKCFIVMSSGRPYRGRRYKFVASILEEAS